MIDGEIKINLNMLGDLIRTAPAQADQAVRAAAQQGRNMVVLSLQTRSPGEEQIRYDPRRVVTAADPGETPNTDTGNLVNSVQVEPRGPFTQAIVVGAEYGPPLEYGTAHMPARPFMTPMAMQLEQDLPDFFVQLFGALP
jgi:hypothetical protein